MANKRTSLKITSEQEEEVKAAFDGIDEDGNGYIMTEELGKALTKVGLDLPGFKLRELISEYDTVTKDGKLNYEEFKNCYLRMLSEKTEVALSFKKAVTSRSDIKQHGGSSAASSVGTTHSFSEEETSAFTDWINSVLQGDEDLKHCLPIQNDHKDLFEKCNDGILLCKLINSAVSSTIDERAINKIKNMNTFKLLENNELAISSASSIGCNVVNISSTNIRDGTPHIILGLLWQIIRIGLLNDINLANHPGLANLLYEGETLEDLQKLTPEQLLIRWVNYHMEQAGNPRRITGFSEDIKDSEVYTHLLCQIAPAECNVNPINLGKDWEKRAENMLVEADKMDCRSFVTAKDVVQGNSKLNLAFVANLFNKYPALEPPEDIDLENFEETREEKTYRNWMNSIGISPYVHRLYSDLSDGLVLLKLYDIIQPGIVDWDRVNGPETFKKMGGNMKRIENCNYAVKLAVQMKFSVVGLGGKDINDENKTLTLALVWQLMRAYTLSVLTKLRADSDHPITENEIIQWANDTLKAAGKQRFFRNFKDQILSDGVVIADLLDAVKPGCVNYSFIERDCQGNDEPKLANAKYVISLARKMGARVYALPEDIVEMKNKMIMTIFACIMMKGMST